MHHILRKQLLFLKTSLLTRRLIVTVTAAPETALVDEPVSISVRGLSSFQDITLSCQLCEDGRHFEAYAYYQADTRGICDLDTHASIGGSYKGVEPMGLVWSMIQNPGQKDGLRIIKRNIEEPIQFRLKVYKGHKYSPQKISPVKSATNSAVDSAVDSPVDSPVDLAEDSAVHSPVNSAADSAVDSAVDSKTKYKTEDAYLDEQIESKGLTDTVEICELLAETSFYKLYLSPDVKFYDVHVGKLRGRIFIPKGEGPFPAVIDMFGTNGGLLTFRSALLASRGIISYALPYFDYLDLPAVVSLDFEYFEEAIEWLYKHPLVNKSGIGVVGVSKGAQLALEMAVRSSKILACVAINTIPFHSVGSHYYKGEPLPCYNPQVDQMISSRNDEGIILANSFRITKENEHEIKEAMIKIQNSANASILLINGEDDLAVDHNNISVIEKIMYDNNMGHRFYSLRYPGTGHLIEPPIMPLCRRCFAKFLGDVFVYGGQPKEHSLAQEDAWNFMLSFIKHKIDPKKNPFSPSSKFLRQSRSKI